MSLTTNRQAGRLALDDRIFRPFVTRNTRYSRKGEQNWLLWFRENNGQCCPTEYATLFGDFINRVLLYGVLPGRSAANCGAARGDSCSVAASRYPGVPAKFASGAILGPPVVTENPQPPAIQLAVPAATDTPLPINLATALYLSNARSLTISYAQASVEEAAARLRGSQVLWLPDLNVGTDFYRHDGLDQSTDGAMVRDHQEQLRGRRGCDYGSCGDRCDLPATSRSPGIECAGIRRTSSAERRRVTGGVGLFRRAAGPQRAAWQRRTR